jgi:InsA N-terminal domain
MVLIPVRCLYCQSDQVTKRGRTAKGKQRYRCHNHACAHQSFLLDPAYKGRALITGPATLLPPSYPAARRGGLNGAGGRATDGKIAANIERGF